MTSIFRLTTQCMFVFGCLTGALSVLIAAYCAHIPGLEEASLRSLQSAIQMMQFHALALLMVAWMYIGFKSSWVLFGSGLFFLTGIVLFSFNIVLHQLAGISLFRPLIPVGGMAFVAAWVVLAISVFRSST
jgi:uncharacterized membrane protein YgdD (TMEM256/DUF423 family)